MNERRTRDEAGRQQAEQNHDCCHCSSTVTTNKRPTDVRIAHWNLLRNRERHSETPDLTIVVFSSAALDSF